MSEKLQPITPSTECSKIKQSVGAATASKSDFLKTKMDLVVGYTEPVKMKDDKGQRQLGCLLIRKISNKGKNFVVYNLV